MKFIYFILLSTSYTISDRLFMSYSSCAQYQDLLLLKKLDNSLFPLSGVSQHPSASNHHQ